MWAPDEWQWMLNNVPILCVDGVVVNENNEVLLSLRDDEPERGKWHLPGGVVGYGERLEVAMRRVMKEETGLEVEIKKLVGIYDDPKRDPRGRFVTVAFLLKAENKPVAGRQAKDVRYFSELPSNMGFDSRKIAEDGLKLAGQL